MRRLIPIIVSIYFLSISCKGKVKDTDVPTIPVDKKINLNIPGYPAGLFINVNSIIAYLDNDAPLEGRRIGYGGRDSESYKYFVLLKNYAPDSTLVRLTLHSNPKLRVYGMWALIERNKELARQLLYRFKTDMATVYYFEYCTSMQESVSSLVLRHFDREDLGINYSTQQFIQEPY